MTRYFVTGAAGFIASTLVDRLLALGHQVVGYDNLASGQERFLADARRSASFQFVTGDILDANALTSAMKGADIVFHLAANADVRFGLEHPSRDLEQNTVGTFRVLDAMRVNGITSIAFSSTGSVYGEPQLFPTTETHPFEPVSYYGVSKLAGERYVDVFHKLYGLDTTILRYFHVYGPRQESNEFGGVVSIFLRRITEGRNPIVFGHGKQVRSFTWVGDLVDANLQAAMNPRATGEAYNAASGIRITINELARRMLEILDPEGHLTVEYGEPLIGDIMEFDVSNAKIQDHLGIGFRSDFWETLKLALEDRDSFLGFRVG